MNMLLIRVYSFLHDLRCAYFCKCFNTLGSGYTPGDNVKLVRFHLQVANILNVWALTLLLSDVFYPFSCSSKIM